MIYYPKANDFQNSTYLGTWNQSEIPVYDVPTMHALNQLIGYVKHINAGNEQFYIGDNANYMNMLCQAYCII